MIVKLHQQARTTPASRAEIRHASGTLAARYNVSIDTIRKWKGRGSVADRSHPAHRLQTTLTPAQECIAVELHKILRLGLDDLLVVVREFLNPAVSRSGLDRCLRRHGVSSLRDLAPVPNRPMHKPSKVYDPGYFHMTSNTCHKCRTKRPAAICLSPSTARALGVCPDQAAQDRQRCPV